MKSSRQGALCLAVILAGLNGCGSGSDGPDNPQAAPPAPAPMPSPGPAPTTTPPPATNPGY